MEDGRSAGQGGEDLSKPLTLSPLDKLFWVCLLAAMAGMVLSVLSHQLDEALVGFLFLSVAAPIALVHWFCDWFGIRRPMDT